MKRISRKLLRKGYIVRITNKETNEEFIAVLTRDIHTSRDCENCIRVIKNLNPESHIKYTDDKSIIRMGPNGYISNSSTYIWDDIMTDDVIYLLSKDELMIILL